MCEQKKQDIEHHVLSSQTIFTDISIFNPLISVTLLYLQQEDHIKKKTQTNNN